MPGAPVGSSAVVTSGGGPASAGRTATGGGATALGVGGGGAAVGGTGARLNLPAPPAIELTSPVAGLTFGKAPFLWPLFAVLDVLAMAAVGFVLRKTWSKRVAD